MTNPSNGWLEQAKIVDAVLKRAPRVDKTLRVSTGEFVRRREALWRRLEAMGIDCAFVYSDEHYNGDVPYLGGNTNITIEPVAGVIGRNGFHLLAGLEGGYVAEQLAPRSLAKVHKVEMLKLADEDYPVDAEDLYSVICEAAGCKPKTMALLTPRAVFPLGVYQTLVGFVEDASCIVDAQEAYFKLKYIKSDEEMALTEQAALICDTMLEGMLRVLKPGMTETQVAQWGYAIALEMGAEEMGFDVMVTSGEANRTLIGKALNRVIREGDIVHLGVAPKRDGLTACERVSVVAVGDPADIPPNVQYWFDFVEGAYQAGLDAYRDVAKNNMPAKFQELALVEYFRAHEQEVRSRIGRDICLEKQKPYTGTHNGGYTECQEFYGAITLNSEEPLGEQIVTMLDVAIRGMGNMWNDCVIPGLDYLVVEKTLGKYGREVRVLNRLPVNVQSLVGAGYRA